MTWTRLNVLNGRVLRSAEQTHLLTNFALTVQINVACLVGRLICCTLPSRRKPVLF